MFQPPSDRFAACCTEAFFGYAEATHAMWWEMANEAVEHCDRAVKSASAELDGKPLSWFNPNPGGQANYAHSGQPHLAMPFLSMALPEAVAGPLSAFAAIMPMVSPVEVWLNMYPLRGGPAAWPMAFCMLSAGVPKSVAWPTAEANAAMMEVAEMASGQLQTAFASYRSESGYAAAPSPMAAVAALAVQPMTAYWPNYA